MHEDIIKIKEVPNVNLESLNSVFLGTLITCMKIWLIWKGFPLSISSLWIQSFLQHNHYRKNKLGLKSGGASSEKTTNAELVHILDQQEVVGILICKHSGCITAFCSRTPACLPAQQRLTYTHTHPYTGPQSKKIFQGKEWGMKEGRSLRTIDTLDRLKFGMCLVWAIVQS